MLRLDLVWEHAFASPEAYRRYMVHPYHAGVLDRYLLHDSPERVVIDNDLGAGLVGYALRRSRLRHGRRACAGSSSCASTADASPVDVDRLVRPARSTRRARPTG